MFHGSSLDVCFVFIVDCSKHHCMSGSHSAQSWDNSTIFELDVPTVSKRTFDGVFPFGVNC